MNQRAFFVDFNKIVKTRALLEKSGGRVSSLLFRRAAVTNKKENAPDKYNEAYKL